MLRRTLARLPLVLSLAAVCVLAFTATALAAGAVDPTDSSDQLVQLIYNAFQTGHYAYAVAAMIVVVVSLLRKYWNAKWMHTDEGAAGLAFATAFGGALMTALGSSGTISLHLMLGAAAVACGAIGGYAAIKKLIIVPLAPHLPAWLRGPLVWLFEHELDTAPPPPPAAPAPMPPTPAPSPTAGAN